MLCFLLCERQVFSPKFEWTVLIAILLNVGIMSLEYETDGGRNEQLISIATACNEAFAYIFLLEMALKHLALGLRKYWADNWNRFDGAIVSISMAEIVVEKLAGVRAHTLNTERSVLRMCMCGYRL
eukprot:COSAG05_NODE_5017_length_1288_cov_5.077866_2_plen_126_part_00